MAQVRTGYAGRDMRGRPIGPMNRDIGAASASTDGLAALGRLSATKLDPYLQGDAAHAAGAGPVERRQETPEERAAREARDAAAIRVRPAPVIRPASPGFRSVFVPGDPVTPIQLTRPHAAAPVTPPAKEEIAMPAPATAPPPAIPCGTCAHAVVCSLRAMLEDLGPLEPVQIIDTGLRAVATVYRIECDHYLEQAAPSPTRIRTASIEEVQASRQRGGVATSKVYAERRAARVIPAELTARQRQVLDAVLHHDGDRRAAATELGIQYQSVDVTLEGVAAKGLIPDTLLEKLPPRFRRPAQAEVAS